MKNVNFILNFFYNWLRRRFVVFNMFVKFVIKVEFDCTVLININTCLFTRYFDEVIVRFFEVNNNVLLILILIVNFRLIVIFFIV